MVAGVLLVLGGCARTHRVVVDPSTQFETRELVEVWQADTAMQLQAVRLSGDTLSGVGRYQAVDCDSCRVRVPLAAVDSVRAGSSSEGTAMLLIGGALAFALVAALVFQSGF